MNRKRYSQAGLIPLVRIMFSIFFFARTLLKATEPNVNIAYNDDGDDGDDLCSIHDDK